VTKSSKFQAPTSRETSKHHHPTSREAPNSKRQPPEKLQTLKQPKASRLMIEAWNLVIHWSLELGDW
jgi:hypothetical protein